MAEDKGVKDEGEVKLPEESPTLKETTEEVKEPEAEVATEEQGTETETAESKKGASSRIRELNEAKKLAEEKATLAEAKAKSLSEQMTELTQPIGFPTQQEYKPSLQPGQEITPEQYQTDVARTASAQVELRIMQERVANKHNSESEKMMQKYPQLNPDSENFDSELSDTVTEAVKAHVKADPYKTSVTKVVDNLMKPFTRSVAKEVGQVTENIAKQVSETALRPNSVRQPEKTVKEKSIAELEQELGTVVT